MKLISHEIDFFGDYFPPKYVGSKINFQVPQFGPQYIIINFPVARESKPTTVSHFMNLTIFCQCILHLDELKQSIVRVPQDDEKFNQYVVELEGQIFEIHCPIAHGSKSSVFVQKFNFDFPRKIVELFWVKIRGNAAVLDFLAVDNFDFTRKIVKKIWVKNS